MPYEGKKRQAHEKNNALTTPDTYETPTKEAAKPAKPFEDNLNEPPKKQAKATSTADLARESSFVAASKQSLPAGPLRLRLFVQVLANNKEFAVDATPQHSPNQVKEIISTRIGVAPELLKLTGPANASKPKFNWPLEESDWQDGCKLICEQLEIPESFDGVHECDECGDLRHVSYSYSRRDPLAEPEPVIELCADCNNPASATSLLPQVILTQHSDDHTTPTKEPFNKIPP